MRFIAVSLLLFLPLSLQSQGPVIRLPAPTTYMMTQLGDQCVRRHYSDGSKSRDITWTVTDVKLLEDGSRIVTTSMRYTHKPRFLLAGVDNENRPDEVVDHPVDRRRVCREGEYLVEEYDVAERKWVKRGPPWLSFRHPLVPGETRSFGDKEAHWFTIVDRPEKVKVLAGAFMATPIHTAMWQKSLYHQPNIKRTSWIVAGIGNVKSMIDGELAMELVSFTPAKKK